MNRPRIKTAHRPVLRPGGAIWIGSAQYRLGTEIDGADAVVVWQACQTMDGSRTRAEAVRDIALTCGVSEGSAEEVVDFLIGSGWVEDADGDMPPGLSARELERYRASADLLSWIDLAPRSSPYELQARLKASRVTVLGVGGIGSAVAVSLVASGVGHVHCVDGDTVELSNLNRQIHYSESDIGRPKVEALTERLRALNSDVDVTAANLMISGAAELRAEVAGSDIFVHSADQPEDILSWSNMAALELGIPWVLAMYTGPMLAVSTFVPGQTGCFQCMIDQEKSRLDAAGNGDLTDAPRLPGFNPVMAPTAQMTAHLGALEVLYYLMDMPVQTAGRQLHRNFLDYEHQYYVDAPVRTDCSQCGQYARAAAG
jgi:molybdopterin-synthase adenylyltransferase